MGAQALAGSCKCRNADAALRQGNKIHQHILPGVLLLVCARLVSDKQQVQLQHCNCNKHQQGHGMYEGCRRSVSRVSQPGPAGIWGQQPGQKHFLLGG